MTTAEAFREFVERAQRLRSFGEQIPKPTASVTYQFRQFAEAADQCVRAALAQSAGALHAVLRPSATRIGEHDLLALGGLSLVENAYTRLLAWALDPTTHESSALARQRAWLAHIGIDRQPNKAASPTLFLSTLAGIPDLVLPYGDFVVVVEAKTITDEHTTPGGQLQSHAYGPAVAKTLGRPTETVETVYLTLDRSLPDNQAARPVSHLGSWLAITGALMGNKLPEDVCAGFRIIVTHFAANAGRPARDLRRIIRKLGDTNGSSLADIDSGDLRDLLALRRLLLGSTI